MKLRRRIADLQSSSQAMRSLSRVIVIPLHENCILIHLIGILWENKQKLFAQVFFVSSFALFLAVYFAANNKVFKLLWLCEKVYLVIFHVNRRNNERNN